VITVEEAKSLATELETVEGMQFDRGYLSPYFVTDTEKLKVELDDPYILVHEKKLSNLQPMVPLLEKVVQSGRPCSSSPRTSRARRSRRLWSTGCGAASRLRRSRLPALVTAARPCSKTSPF
jgi:hypothetical protein